MAYYDGDFDQFLEDRLKRCKAARFSNSGKRPQPKTGKSFRFNRKLVWLGVSYLVVIGLLFGSFGTAYAAKDSLPNEPLYAIKLAGEELQLFLTYNTNARISLLTTFANRRADEATILASQGQPVPEQVTTLIVEYQKEIDELATIMVDETDEDGVYRRLQPRDQDNVGGIDDHDDGNEDGLHQWENHVAQPTPLPESQTATMLDSEIPHTTISITDTIGITGTKNMTITRAGESYGPGPCETPGSCTPPEDVHSPGPYTYSYSDDEAVPPHAPGIYEGYGPGYAGEIPQQPPNTNQLNGNGSSNKSSENKNNKP